MKSCFYYVSLFKSLLLTWHCFASYLFTSSNVFKLISINVLFSFSFHNDFNSNAIYYFLFWLQTTFIGIFSAQLFPSNYVLSCSSIICSSFFCLILCFQCFFNLILLSFILILLWIQINQIFFLSFFSSLFCNWEYLFFHSKQLYENGKEVFVYIYSWYLIFRVYFTFLYEFRNYVLVLFNEMEIQFLILDEAQFVFSIQCFMWLISVWFQNNARFSLQWASCKNGLHYVWPFLNFWCLRHGFVHIYILFSSYFSQTSWRLIFQARKKKVLALEHFHLSTLNRTANHTFKLISMQKHRNEWSLPDKSPDWIILLIFITQFATRIDFATSSIF